MGEESEKLKVYKVYGEEGNLKPVHVHDIAQAILSKRDVDIKYAEVMGDPNQLRTIIGNKIRDKGYIKITHSSKVFYAHGVRGKGIDIQAEDVLDAIKNGLDINLKRANVKGELNLDAIKEDLVIDNRSSQKRHIVESNFNVSSVSIFDGHVTCRNITFRGIVCFENTTIKGATCFNWSMFENGAMFINVGFSNPHPSNDAYFNKAIFETDASFYNSHFRGNAYFEETQFNGKASFDFTSFAGAVIFDKAHFTESVEFLNASMESPGSFREVDFHENKVRNMILRKAPTDFSKFNAGMIMDASTNPYLRRYIEDEQWISSWRERRRKTSYRLWKYTSYFGRSLILWGVLSLVLVSFFAVIYRWVLDCDDVAFNVGKLISMQPDFWSYLYYSTSVANTFGFGV